MLNERITENLVRDRLRKLKYYDSEAVTIEEQRSDVAAIKRLLRGASKTGGVGSGYPEFIITTSATPDFIFIIECKADAKKHQSKTFDQVKDFAVDGILHYAKSLSREFNIIAVAISGQTKADQKFSAFIHPKLSKEAKILCNKSGKPLDELISLDDLISLGSYDPSVEKQRHDDLMAFSRELHDFMRDHAKLTESEKPLLVSGTLIALRNEPFAKSFVNYKPSELQKAWLRVIKEEIEKADIPNSKKDNMAQPYSSIAVHPELGKPTKVYPYGVLRELIQMLNNRVWPFLSIYHDFDVVGQFYGEFLKYTGGDKKALGIVLTPRHITELFASLANLNKKSRVLDICCGTGGFLISSMTMMIKQAMNKREIEYIKKEGLIGVEQQPNMYALAASNMILRGDGKANLYQGSCFDQEITKEIKKHKCDTGMVNPPYAQKDEESQELKFVFQMLNLLEKGGTGIAIVPMSCAINPSSPGREELLKYHTLEAVMSMPDELFYPVGTVTCIMVFTSHVPHGESNKKTWFGYWKDDGFVKTKHLGRVDLNETWATIRESWIDAFRNRDNIPGLSVKQKVGPNDEWCAEAYMETDYSKLTEKDFENTIRNYTLFRLNEQAENDKSK